MSNKGRRFPAEILTENEVGRLMAVACPRDRALLAVLYRGGLRISEALDLRPKDLDSEAGAVTVLRGKGGKRRVAGLDPEAFRILKTWLEQRAADEAAPVFCSKAGRRLASSYVRALLPVLAQKAGISKRVHAHGLRHTMAVELVNEGVSLLQVSGQLGHASTATTDRYLRHLAPAELLETMKGRVWKS